MSSGAPPPVSADQFFAVDIRVGRVISCDSFPEARRPAYSMVIDFGQLGHRKSSARLTDTYEPDELIDTLVVAVVNLPPRQVGPLRSEVLVLGAYRGGGESVALLRPDPGCQPGDRVG